MGASLTQFCGKRLKSYRRAHFRITMSVGGGPSTGQQARRQRHDVLHAVEHELVSIDLEPDADPPKVLVIGPDSAGNLLEVIVLVLATTG
jgi:hypothetical protein